MRTLANLKTGETANIINIKISGDGFINRLYALGIKPNSKVKMIRNHRFFPLHICVGMTEIVMRKKYAKEIIVG